MKLQETISMMESTDYKERFKAEYYQLAIRIEGLNAMLKQYKEGTLPFKPATGYDLLKNQLSVMRGYQNYLIERARIENIELKSIFE